MTALEVWSINFKRFIDFIPNYFSTSPMDVSFELQTTTGSSVRTFPNLIKQVGLNGVVNAGTHNVSTWKEAVILLESFSNKRILGDVVVQLPIGTLDAYNNAVNLSNAGGVYQGKITLRGAGKDVTTIQKGVGQWAMFMLENANLYIENLTIDEKGETNRSLRIENNSNLFITDNSVRIKNSNAVYTIEVTDSKIDARNLSLENCNGGVSLYRSKGLLDYFNFTSSTTATSKALRVERNSYLSSNYSKVVNDGELEYGIYARNNCFVNAYMAEVSAKRSICAARGCVVEADRMILNSKHYGVLLYDNTFLGGSYTNSTLDATEGESHYHLDSSCTLYTKENTLRDGKRIARVLYGSLFRIYNSTDHQDINDGTNDNYISVEGMSKLQESGSIVTCNILNNTTQHPGGTRF